MTSIRKLDPPITKEEVKRECKEDCIGKNEFFGCTVDALSQSSIFKSPDIRGIAYLLYDETDWTYNDDGTPKDTWGMRRLQNHRVGRRAFCQREREFWYNAFKMAWGNKIAELYDQDNFVTTPISEILHRIRDRELSLPWNDINPAQALRLLELGQPEDKHRPRLKIEKVENYKGFTNLTGEANVQSKALEDLTFYKIGDAYRLEVGYLNPKYDFVVLEFADQPIVPLDGRNQPEQAQRMPDFYRDGPFAYVLDSNKKDELTFGENGMVPGRYGFCAISFPPTDDGLDPFGLHEIKGLLTPEEFSDVVLKLRHKMHHDDTYSLNLAEFNLIN